MRYRLVSNDGKATDWSRKEFDKIEQRGNYLYALSYKNGRPFDGGIGGIRFSDKTSPLAGISLGKWYKPNDMAGIKLTRHRMSKPHFQKKIAEALYDYVEVDGAMCEDCGKSASRVTCSQFVRNARVNDPEYTQHYLCEECYAKRPPSEVPLNWWERPSKMPTTESEGAAHRERE